LRTGKHENPDIVVLPMAFNWMLGGFVKSKVRKKIYWYNWLCVLETMSDKKLHCFLYTNSLPDWPHHQDENQPVCWDPETAETHHTFLKDFKDVNYDLVVAPDKFCTKAHKHDYVALERDWDLLKSEYNVYKYIQE